MGSLPRSIENNMVVPVVPGHVCGYVDENKRGPTLLLTDLNIVYIDIKTFFLANFHCKSPCWLVGLKKTDINSNNI